MNIQNYQQLFGSHRQRFEFRPSHNQLYLEGVETCWFHVHVLSVGAHSGIRHPEYLPFSVQWNNARERYPRESGRYWCYLCRFAGHGPHNLTVWWAFCLQESGKQSFICGPVVFLMARGFKSVFCTLWTRPACTAQNGPCPENRLVSQLFRMGANRLCISPSRGQSSTCYHEMFFSENCFKMDSCTSRKPPEPAFLFSTHSFCSIKNQPGWACWPKWPGTTPNLSSSSLKLVRLWPIQ